MAHEGGREDQRAAAACQQGRYLVLGAQKGTGEVGGDGVLPGLQREIGEGAGIAGHAGIVEGDVQATKARRGGLDQRLCQRLVPHVAGQRDGLAAVVLDLRHQRLQLRLAAGREDQPGAVAGKQSGGFAAYA